MWLILANAYDPVAHWVHEGLLLRGLTQTQFVSAESLIYSSRWEHRLDANGNLTRTTLADGRVLEHAEVQGTLNRLSYLPNGWLTAGHAGDHDYATQEFHAFMVSWLHALPHPVLNPPTPQGLSGAWRQLSEWVQLASRAGLPTLTYRLSSRTLADSPAYPLPLVPESVPVNTLVVVAGHVFGEAPPALQSGCRRLAELADTPLLGIDFSREAERWTFIGASILPDLRIGGDDLLDVLASVFTKKLEVVA